MPCLQIYAENIALDSKSGIFSNSSILTELELEQIALLKFDG